ncbi:MAG: TIM barrel protein [Pirellulales bacterium]|nr:TIM barrel protein [Pirellulales bacterium]
MTEKTNRRSFLGTATWGAAAIGAAGAALGSSSLSTAQEREVASDDQIELSKLGSSGKTRFAVNVEMWWRREPFLNRLRKAAELGFPAVEFWEYGRKDIDAIASLAKELNLQIAQFTAWGFSPGLNNPDNHADFVARIKNACEVAKKLDCDKMTVVGGNDQRGMTQAEMHDNIIAGLKQAAPIAEDNGVMMILEPMNIRVDHKGHCLYGSPDAVRICQEVDSPMAKINWDLYHMQISEGDLTRRMREGYDQIGYLQLADNPGRHEPGTGEVYYNRVLKEAYKLGYRECVGLECSPAGDEITAAKRVAAADVW